MADITYRNIVVHGSTDYGILVDQSYGGTDGKPTNGVIISNFVLQNATGTVDSNAVNIHIECGAGSCSNFEWTGVSITGGKSSKSCLNVPAEVSC